MFQIRDVHNNFIQLFFSCYFFLQARVFRFGDALSVLELQQMSAQYFENFVYCSKTHWTWEVNTIIVKLLYFMPLWRIPSIS